MNPQNFNQAKQLVTSSHDIAYRMKLVQHDLLMLVEINEHIKDVQPDLKEKSDEIIKKLESARGTIAESIATANEIYHFGLNALKEG